MAVPFLSSFPFYHLVMCNFGALTSLSAPSWTGRLSSPLLNLQSMAFVFLAQLPMLNRLVYKCRGYPKAESLLNDCQCLVPGFILSGCSITTRINLTKHHKLGNP